MNGLAATLPWSWYVDDAVLDAELDAIFGSAWHYVGDARRLTEPGAFVTVSAGRTPVVVVRDGNELRAFANVCRHRGSLIVAEGSGNRRTLQCPYHAWTYALDGSLIAAPRSEREPGFTATALDLIGLHVDTWGPLVFVNASSTPLPLLEALGDVPRELEAAGIHVGALRFDRRVDWEAAANWKIVVENYLECYHCPVAHRDFSRVVDVSPDAYRLDVRGRVAHQFGPARDGGPGGHFHFVWPNLKINVFPGPPNLSIGPVVPGGAERSTGFLDYFFAPEADDRWLRDFFELDDTVGREDRALVESVQRGVRSGVLEHGALLPESERLVAWFQEEVRAALAAAA